jgi:hypothetical protein
MVTVDDIERQIEELQTALRRREFGERELEELTAELARIKDRVEAKPVRHSTILELKGMGKEIWENIDVDEYIREERRSWR